MAARFGRKLNGRKPLVIYSRTYIFGKQISLWNVVKNWYDSETDTEYPEEYAQAVIRRYALPLAYEDENGKVWADPESNPWAEVRNRRAFDRETKRGLSGVRTLILSKF